MKKPFWAHAISRLDGLEADGIHLLWSAPPQAGYAVSGYDIQRRPASGEPQLSCHQLTPSELSTLGNELMVDTPVGTVRQREGRTPQPPPQPPDKVLAPAPPCTVYRADLEGSFDHVELSVGGPWALAVALREDKAVAADHKEVASGIQSFSFSERGIEAVVVYVPQPTTHLMICREVVSSFEDEEADWAAVPFIAQGVQMPLVKVNPALGDADDELDLAVSRLLPGETLDQDAFEEVTAILNAAAEDAVARPPVYGSRLTRSKPENPFFELTAWPFATTLLAEPTWRRALGFGYFDAGSGLNPGQSYDYRITARFRRRDLEERFVGFHTVPTDTTLPPAFHLGPVYCTTNQRLQVGVFPALPDGVLEHPCRRGIALDGRLDLHFPTPVQQVVLELEPGFGQNLGYKATTTDWIFGLGGTTFQDAVPAAPRVTLSFPEPVDRVRLEGRGFLYGLRLPTVPASGDPEDLLPLSVVVRFVGYAPTAPPPAPPVLATSALQKALAAGTPESAVENPPRSLGFRLDWLPPALTATGTLPWPEDLEAAPPFEQAAFEIERRRVDTGEPFGPLDAPQANLPTTRFVANRTARPAPRRLSSGVDLLRAFPESVIPTPPVPAWMGVDDVLTSHAKPEGPPPGSEHQYRIWSLDPLGRRSPSPTVGTVERLEKHLPPPQPVTAPDPEPPAGGEPLPPRPRGVRARVLLAGDPELTAEDQARLGTSDNAIVLEWGWRQEQRDHDPYAREFRVYLQDDPPDRLAGSLSGAPVVVGDNLRMAATLARGVAADALAGLWIRSGGYPFRVVGNTAGSQIDILFAPSGIDPSRRPQAGDFVLQIPLDGGELRPATWTERVGVVAIDAAEGYELILRDRLLLDADHPRALVWVGVSCADDQPYVADELDAALPNGGRPGNESTIAAVVATAHYQGRPAFTPPIPLADVPEEVLDEPVETVVNAPLDLPAWLPSLSVPAGHRVLVERLPLAEVAGMMSALENDQIGATLPDDSEETYTLADAGDQAALLAAIRSGEPIRVANKFLLDFLIRFADRGFDSRWQAVVPAPVPFDVLDDTLPAKAERYAYRLRLADRRGRLSTTAALVPRVVRVPSLRVPAAPTLRVIGDAGDVLTLELITNDAFDVNTLLVFTLSIDASTPMDRAMLARARLLRLPNRRDLYPDGIRLRLPDGTLLSPTVVDAGSGTVEQRQRRVETTVSPGFNQRVHLWAASLTRDGIPSRLAGPVLSLTNPAPPVVPALTVSAAAGVDQASWPADPTLGGIAIERSEDGGNAWQRVSPWLPGTVDDFDLTTPPAGARLYRLVARGPQAQAHGNPVAPTPAA